MQIKIFALLGAFLASTVCNAMTLSLVCQTPGSGETFLLGTQRDGSVLVVQDKSGRVANMELLSITKSKIDPNFFIYDIEQPKPGTSSISVFGGGPIFFHTLHHQIKINMAHPATQSEISIENADGKIRHFKTVCSNKIPALPAQD